MSVALVEIVEHERRFPPAVESELAARRAAALASVDGRVLDLDDAGARVLLAAAIDHGTDRAIEPVWDAIVSVAQLLRFPDLAAALRAADRLLCAGGRLVAVEPVAKPGTMRMFVDAPFALSRVTRGFHIGRDLPAALRTTSLVTDDIDRFRLRTANPLLRHFVSVTARRAHTAQEST